MRAYPGIGATTCRVVCTAMKVLDPGHLYQLTCLDGDHTEFLQFVKRVGEHYPGNVSPGYAGTICQEVLRALIDRTRYLHRQIPCVETEAIVGLLSAALVLFEIRAKRVKGKNLVASVDQIERGPICPQCGHVLCTEHRAMS